MNFSADDETVYVYMVRCANGTLYTGLTAHIQERINDHNSGRGGRYTRLNRPVTLMAAWAYQSRRDARRAERAIKRLPQDKKLELAEAAPRIETFKSKSSPRATQKGKCEVCGRHARSVLCRRIICQPCHRNEPSTTCPRCRTPSHLINEATGLCPRCTRVVSRREGECARCSQATVIFNEEKRLCEKCNNNQWAKLKSDKLKVIVCSRCGQARRSALVKESICQPCYKKEINEAGECARCKKFKFYAVQKERLCKACYLDSLAPKMLRDYAESYFTPYLYNKEMFDLFVKRVERQDVTSKVTIRVKYFGAFLRSHELSEPIVWEQLEGAYPPLGAKNRNKPKTIRSCLLNLGYLLAELGRLESYETYNMRKSALQPIARAPSYAQPVLHSYSEWLLYQRKTLPANVRDHFETLVIFLQSCEERGINLPEGVRPSDVNDFLTSLFWQWRCSTCQNITPYDPRDRNAPRICNICDAVRNHIKVERYSQNTVRGHASKLRVFFYWAGVNRLRVGRNPVQRKIAPPEQTVRHYPPEIIERLCTYMVDPDADPVEALILYLIIFHGCYVWELCHAKLPAVISLKEGMPRPSLAEAYYIDTPELEPSRGRHSRGRPQNRICFWPEVATWLTAILRRFERDRQTRLRDPDNLYLIVASGCSPRNGPVNKSFILACVQRTSRRVLGVTINPDMLRKTAGVIFTDLGDSGILTKMGWSPLQASKYNWLPRVAVHPQYGDILDIVVPH